MSGFAEGSPHDRVKKLIIPPWGRWRVRRGLDVQQPAGRGAHGRRLCRWCGREVAPRRSTFCGEGCVDQFLCVASWEALAETIKRRDRRCRRCKLEHPGWMRYDWHSSWDNEKRRIYRGEQGPACPLAAAPWQCDHIIPVADGGDDRPANLRLLCYPCHLHVTREWRRGRRRSKDDPTQIVIGEPSKPLEFGMRPLPSVTDDAADDESSEDQR
jgi:5-methylcytosine-specific restriction endonuclease McrA